MNERNVIICEITAFIFIYCYCIEFNNDFITFFGGIIVN